MRGKSSRTSKKRNVSETTVTSSNDLGSLTGDLAYYSGENPASEREMDRYCTSSSSDSDDEGNYQTVSRTRNSQKPKCFSKNAILARRNRVKKKKYLEDLENEVKALRAENSTLRVNVEGYSKDMEVVRKENRYLRNVLASRREISRLLGVLQDKTGLVTSSSLCKAEVQGNHGKAYLSNLGNIGKANHPISVPNPAPVNEPMIVLPQRDLEICAEGESMESPITFNDASLLGTECGDEELSLPLSLFSSNDHDYLDFDTDIPEDWLAGDEELPNIGVCLHVAKKRVSLEFCQFCNEKAAQCWDGNVA